MDTISGTDAIRMMKEVCKLPDGDFTIAFYRYNRTMDIVIPDLTIRKNCKSRAQLPQEKFQLPSENYFLFLDKDGNHKSCFRVLIRFVGFPPDYKMLKVKWFKDE